MDTKSLSFRQVCWAQKLSYYHFQIDYCQDKANEAADACFDTLNKVQKRKRPFVLRTSTSSTVCSRH